MFANFEKVFRQRIFIMTTLNVEATMNADEMEVLRGRLHEAGYTDAMAHVMLELTRELRSVREQSRGELRQQAEAHSSHVQQLVERIRVMEEQAFEARCRGVADRIAQVEERLHEQVEQDVKRLHGG